MGQDPSDIRAEIEETRARVGDEVDALSYKTDVGARVGDYVDEKKEAVGRRSTAPRTPSPEPRRKPIPSWRARWAACSRRGRAQPARAGGRRRGGRLRRRAAAPVDPHRGRKARSGLGQGGRGRPRRLGARQADRPGERRGRDGVGEGEREPARGRDVLEPPGPPAERRAGKQRATAAPRTAAAVLGVRGRRAGGALRSPPPVGFPTLGTAGSSPESFSKSSRGGANHDSSS